MSTKKFIIEVEEGRTKCDNFCPLKQSGHCADIDGDVENVIPFLRCIEYNLATMKIKEYEDNTRDTSVINRD